MVQHQRLTDIIVEDFTELSDIAACEQTSQVYVADPYNVWRMSADDADIERWLPKSPDTFKPWTLSVTSTRLLVTSYLTRQLIQFDAHGDELRRVQLQDSAYPWHAVESPTGTFIVGLYNKQLKHSQVTEVNTGGEVMRQFGSPLGDTQDLHVAVDSHGNVFVADCDNHHILLLDDHLSLRRVIIDEHQLNEKPRRLCYREQSGQLLVALENGGITVFDVLRRR